MATAHRSRTFKIGITGSVCSGKSVVRNILSNYGLSTVDVSNLIYTIVGDNPTLIRKLTKQFGNEVLDQHGRLNRKKLEKLAHSNPNHKKAIDDVFNPLLREEVKRFLYGPLGTYIRVVESPQLFETGSEHLYDEIWTVKTDAETIIGRLMERDNLKHEEAHLRLIVEMPLAEKIEKSHRIIDNSGERVKTEQRVRELYEEVKNRVFSVGF